MKTKLELENIKKIDNELDYERALIQVRKLRLLEKEDAYFKTLRINLRDMIVDYETKHWSDFSKIDNEKIKESDLAETIAENERIFLQKRKGIIKNKLKNLNLTQQELGIILGHKSKTHVSELMNGICPFSLKDLIVIHEVLKINMNDLIPISLSVKDRNRVNLAIKKLDNPKMKLVV